MKAIRVHETGGPDALVYEDIPTPEPGEGEVRVAIKAAGLNFIDTYHRGGLYKVDLPITPGVEGAGVVDAVGAGVDSVKVGERVAYCMHLGAYAEYAIVSAAKLVPVPDGVDFATAATAMVQGMTAHYLTHSTYTLKEGDSCFIHAAAGGTGQLAVQMAKLRGATVFGTVSTEEKEELARSLGADHIIRYTEQDFEEETMRLTDGAGVNVVYDSVGKTTFQKSMNILKPRGYLVLFGQSSGPVDPLDPNILNPKGSLYLTRPSLAHYVSEREELLQRAHDVFGWIADGKLKLRLDRKMPLAEAAEAHRLLEGRKTAGKVILEP